MLKHSEGPEFITYISGITVENHFVNSVMGVSVSVPGMGEVVSSVAVPVVVLLIMVAAMLFALMLRKSGGSEEKVAPTWLCGYQDLNNKNRYTAHNMYAVFKKALWWTGGNIKK